MDENGNLFVIQEKIQPQLIYPTYLPSSLPIMTEPIAAVSFDGGCVIPTTNQSQVVWDKGYHGKGNQGNNVGAKGHGKNKNYGGKKGCGHKKNIVKVVEYFNKGHGIKGYHGNKGCGNKVYHGDKDSNSVDYHAGNSNSI